MPARQLVQKQVRMMAGIVDVVKNNRAPDFAGVVDHDVTKTEDALENRGRDRDVLDFAKWNVARRARYQAIVNFDLRVSNCVANHIALEMVIRGNQKQAKRDRKREIPGNIDSRNHRQENGEGDRADDGGGITELYKHQGRPCGKNDVLNVCFVIIACRRYSLWPRNPGFFAHGSAALLTEARIRIEK